MLEEADPLWRKVHLKKLQDLCKEKYGLINRELRKRAWPLLLNVESIMLHDGTCTRRQVPLLKLSQETEW